MLEAVVAKCFCFKTAAPELNMRPVYASAWE
jgi:hypothetical protein